MIKTLSAFFILIILFTISVSMTLKSFNEIKDKYKDIEPNLDNYSAAEVIFLSFERMRTSLFYEETNSYKNFTLKKQVFDSKIQILENKSEYKNTFFYDKEFKKEMTIIKEQSLLLNSYYSEMVHKKRSRDDVIAFFKKMEETLIDLQEVIYRIQIYNFNETKQIIQDNTSQTEALAIICLSLLFIIITVLLIHFRKLNKTLKEKNTFISSIYHELSTSIQAIAMASDIISHNGVQKETSIISRITHHANKLLIQTRDILDYSKIEIGNIGLRESTFMINDLVNEAISSIDSNNKNKFIIYKSTMINRIISDQQKILRIIINLLDNADKNTKNGVILVSTKIINKKLFVLIKDNGCGFNIKKLNYLYKPFNQGAEKDTKQGLGLGLTIIKNYVDVLKGKIKVKSQKNKGSSFIISIPVHISHKNFPT